MMRKRAFLSIAYQKCIINPINMLRYVFKPIILLRYNSEHSTSQCVFLKTDIANRVFDFGLMKMYFLILDFANCNSRFTDFIIAVFDKFIDNRTFNPTVPLRYVFNPIRTLRYGFEHSRSQLALLKMECAFRVFQEAKLKNEIYDNRNQKTQFVNSVFRIAHCESSCSKSILSDSIGIKAFLSTMVGLKTQFWTSLLKSAIPEKRKQKMRFHEHKIKKHIFQNKNQKIQFAVSIFKNAHYEVPCSESILSKLIELKTILSESIGLKTRFQIGVCKIDGRIEQ